MKILNMSNRELTELPKSNYDEYEIVYLYNNRLTSIPANAFSKATHVDFAGNQLASIPENAFPNAETVYLEHNRLTSIPKNAFPKAEYVSFHNNFLDNYIEKYQGYWDVYAWGYRIKIGCELHTIEEWERFTDEEIDTMDEKALTFWREYKSDILKMAKNML